MPRKNPHAVALGRLGGRVSSPAKALAVRRNAQKGGRPPKFTVGDRVRVNDNAPLGYADRVGRIARVGPGRSAYRVEFTDGGHASGRLMSWWLDRE
jgi:hypothetical protein